eukprot:3658233-Pyramimonas_sp.AAC.1
MGNFTALHMHSHASPCPRPATKLSAATCQARARPQAALPARATCPGSRSVAGCSGSRQARSAAFAERWEN